MDIKVPVFATLLLIVSSWECLADEHDVNPSDPLNFDPVNIQMTNKVQESGLNKEPKVTKNDILKDGQPLSNGSILIDEKDVKIEKCRPTVKDEALKSVFKRYLMSLVRHIESRVDSTDVPVEFCMKMRVTYSDMMLLKLYGTGEIDDVHEVYERLESMVLYPTELPEESPIYWLERKIGLSSPVLMKVIATLSLVIIAAKMLSSVRITRSFIIKGIVLSFVMSSTVTYIELYQQKVADKDKILSEDIAERCPQRSQSTYSRIVGFFTSSFTFENENCREYYEALVVDPFFKVTFFEAGAVAITKTVVAPMKILGHGFKDLLVGLFKDLPSQFSLLLFPVLLVLLVIFPFMMFGYTLKIPFVLTLCPRPSAQQCLPPPKEKTAHCINCIDNKNDQVQDVDNRSTYLTATPSTITSILPAHNMNDGEINKSSATQKVSSTIDGDSDDQAKVVNESLDVQVKEIKTKMWKKCKISPVFKESDSSREAEGKRNEEREIQNEKEVSLRPDSSAATVDVMLSNASVISAACVTDSNTLTNSNFFLDQELRPGDTPTENGCNLFSCESDTPGDVQNCKEDYSNDSNSKTELR